MFENLLKGSTKQTSVSGPLDKIEVEQITQGSLIFSSLAKTEKKKKKKFKLYSGQFNFQKAVSKLC